MSSEARRKAISQRPQQHTLQYGTGKSKSAFRFASASSSL